jgi:hypothetical protein
VAPPGERGRAVPSGGATSAAQADVAEPRTVGRPLRVLFFTGGKKFDARPWDPLFEELTARGHAVHLAFNELPKKARVRERLENPARPDLLTFGAAAYRRAYDGWGPVADLVRRLADLARYSHPRYQAAPALRGRMSSRILKHFSKTHRFEPLARRLALRTAHRLVSATDASLSERTIRMMARLEDAIPSSRRIEGYLRDQAPDVVLVTGVVKKPSQIEFLKSARKLRIPAGICVASWDNLTNKGLLKFAPERVFVWNEAQRAEAVELHGVPADRVFPTGAQLFDEWFERRPGTSQEEFVRQVGLDPRFPYVAYVASSSFITQTGNETDFVLQWISALRASDDERLRSLGVLVRPHPGVPRRWRQAGLDELGNAVVWPDTGVHPASAAERGAFFDTIAHSAAVVGINTTAMIEAAIIGKNVLTIRAPEFGQESTLHFQHLLAENGGFLHVAGSVDEHLRQLAAVLDEADADVERRRRFVESFVRPHGLDRPATAIFADAVEELATLPVARRPSAARIALRLALSAEVAASSLVLLADRRRRAAKARG